MIYKIYVGPTFSVFLEHHVWEQNFMFIYVWDKELENTYTVQYVVHLHRALDKTLNFIFPLMCLNSLFTTFVFKKYFFIFFLL